jgi:ribosomal protein L7/L12
MEILKCELCGSTSFTKIDDMFTCDYCKTKYSLSEAKKIIEALQKTELEINGVARIENLLLRAQQFYNAGEYEKAAEYIEKVLDLDANNVDVQYLKSINVTSVRLVGCKGNIPAIKVIREFTGWELKTTKEFVDCQTPWFLAKDLIRGKMMSDFIKALNECCGARLEGIELHFR